MLAINGCTVASFPYRDGAHTIFGSLLGFDIQSYDGLRLEVHGVDHMVGAANCSGFERLGF